LSFSSPRTQATQTPYWFSHKQRQVKPVRLLSPAVPCLKGDIIYRMATMGLLELSLWHIVSAAAANSDFYTMRLSSQFSQEPHNTFFFTHKKRPLIPQHDAGSLSSKSVFLSNFLYSQHSSAHRLNSIVWFTTSKFYFFRRCSSSSRNLGEKGKSDLDCQKVYIILTSQHIQAGSSFRGTCW
jgi:hypothetical protein